MTGIEFAAGLIGIISLSIIAVFAVGVLCFFIEVPKELKRIADALERRNGNG